VVMLQTTKFLMNTLLIQVLFNYVVSLCVTIANI
jgi:hypothetical protein